MQAGICIVSNGLFNVSLNLLNALEPRSERFQTLRSRNRIRPEIFPFYPLSYPQAYEWKQRCTKKTQENISVKSNNPLTGSDVL